MIHHDIIMMSKFFVVLPQWSSIGLMNLWIELLLGKEPAFLTNRVWTKVVNWRTILVAEGIVVPIRIVNDCAERSLGLVTDCDFDWITRSKEQKFHLYQAVTELRSRIKKIGEKKRLSKKLYETNELLVLNREFDHWCFNKVLVSKCFTARSVAYLRGGIEDCKIA